MRIPRLVLSTVFIFGFLATSVEAASLDKYNVPSSPTLKQAPSKKQSSSPYESQIQNALSVLGEMTPQERDRMLKIYREKREIATQRGGRDEAYYYNEIISRWYASQR